MILLATSFAAAVGCQPSDPFDEPLDVLEPMGTQRGIVYIDVGADEAVFVTPDDDQLDVHRVPLATEDARAQWCRSTLDETGVLVLTVPETEKNEDVDEQLHLLSQDGEVARTWDVLAPYTSLALSPDLRRAVLFFGSGEGGDALRNANQVAIVDLGSDDVRLLTLNGFGGRLQTIQFPGQTIAGQTGLVDVGGQLRDIIAFLAEGEVVLVDAANPTANQVAVQFGALAFTPTQTLIRPADAMFGNPAMFLRGSGSDVAMLTLVDKPDELTGVAGFSTQVSLIPIGTGATDFTYYNGEEAPFLLTVDGGAGALVFTDIRTQESFDVQLGAPATQLFLRTEETSIGTVTQAVAWTPGGAALHTLDLDGVEQALGRAPRRLDVQTGIDELVQLDNDRVLIGSGTNLYVVDFRSEQITPLTSSVSYDPRSSALVDNLLLLGTPGQSRISTVDLTTLDPESMVLDEPIVSFHYLAETGRTLVVHNDPLGYVTVSDASSPTRASSFSSWGFLLDDVLGRKGGER
jgi:hypothetical protein